MIAYHFTVDKLRGGRPIPPVGEWLVHEGPLVMCESGLHASKDPFDALQYAPGNLLHKVDCRGETIIGNDTLVCRKRKILATIDAEPILRQFARECALDVYHLWGNERTDPDGICKRYLETGDESLRTAAGDAAGDAAWAAARAADGAAARFAAWAAAWAAQRKRLATMVNKAFKESK